ncbi:hypothetical protein GE061_011670 [Apolygus lucorum]|uniref:Uncharacterized protein n=1 Tax=Apolygus lucorum TaxID=248454 RepID=A0A8S9XXY8_APOLU|nr:hypothetical protein GE061_011670 [Apolygus lucorum]
MSIITAPDRTYSTKLETSLISPTCEEYDLLQKKLKLLVKVGRGEAILDIGVVRCCLFDIVVASLLTNFSDKPYL